MPSRLILSNIIVVGVVRALDVRQKYQRLLHYSALRKRGAFVSAFSFSPSSARSLDGLRQVLTPMAVTLTCVQLCYGKSSHYREDSL